MGRLLAPPSLPWWWSTGVTPPSLDKCNDDHNVDTSSLGKMRVQIMVQTSQLPRPGNELSLVDPDTGEAEGNPTQTSSAPRVWPPVPVACFKTRGNSRGSENVIKVFSLYLARHSKSFMCKRWIEFNEERRNLQMFFLCLWRFCSFFFTSYLKRWPPFNNTKKLSICQDHLEFFSLHVFSCQVRNVTTRCIAHRQRGDPICLLRFVFCPSAIHHIISALQHCSTAVTPDPPPVNAVLLHFYPRWLAW